MLLSAPSRLLRAFFQLNTTRSSASYSSAWLSGMLLQSSDFTQMTHWYYWTPPSKPLPLSSTNSNSTLQPHFTQKNSQGRLKLGSGGGMQVVRRAGKPQPAGTLVHVQKRSISRRTNCMLLETTLRLSRCLAQLIPIPHKLYCDTSIHVLFLFLFLTARTFIFQGEQAHRTIKRFYASTNKKGVAEQLARQERRHTHIRRQDQGGNPLENDGKLDSPLPVSLRYAMASSTQNFTNLAKLLADSSTDPATKVTLPKDLLLRC